MRRHVSASSLFFLGLFLFICAVTPHWANAVNDPPGCGLCQANEECGANRMCCHADCPGEEMKCMPVVMCP